VAFGPPVKNGPFSKSPKFFLLNAPLSLSFCGKEPNDFFVLVVERQGNYLKHKQDKKYTDIGEQWVFHNGGFSKFI